MSPDPRRWWALAVLATAQFMVIMDTSIIAVALPEMQRDLGFSSGSLQWVFNAYVVALGGLLLLGGRLSDLWGARRIFAAGWTILIVGSVLAAAANTSGIEVAGRAVQGVGAALIVPAAMTLLMVLFAGQPKELPKAMAFYGAAAPAGGTAGVFLGGVITEWLSWPWVFVIYVPIGLLTLALTPAVLPAVPGRRGGLDVARRGRGHRWARPGRVRHRAGTRARLGFGDHAAATGRRGGPARRVRRTPTRRP